MNTKQLVSFYFMATLVLASLCASAETQVNLDPPGTLSGSDLKVNDTLSANITTKETTLKDQTDVAVTVYNNNRALVRDRRKLKLLPGELSLRFMDVAAQIQPETVSLKSLSGPGTLHILEQNYEYDLMSPQKLMEKYVGKAVKLINKNADYSFYEQDATLLSMNQGPVYEIDGDIYLDHPGTVVLPEIPEALIAKPTLVWLLDNQGTDHEMEATYLTGGLSWKADYVLTLNKAENQLDVEGWVTLNNQSGTTYQNAKLKLVAGEVNIVRDRPMVAAGYAKAEMMMDRAPAPMQEEAFAEYHLYTLPRRTTIKEKQSKQVRLLTAEQVPAEKQYEYRGDISFYSRQMQPREKDHIAVYLKFDNEKKNNLGMPLPGGVMRIYQEDSESMLQFSGEDRIGHTPKDEKVKLRMGEAFDIIGERVQIDYNRMANNTHEAEFKITVRNHKETKITVDIVEPMPGDWRILDSSQPYTKKDAHTAIFSCPIKPDKEAVVTYRVRVSY